MQVPGRMQGCLAYRGQEIHFWVLIFSESLDTLQCNQVKSENGPLCQRCLQFPCLDFFFIYSRCLGRNLYYSSDNRVTVVFNIYFRFDLCRSPKRDLKFILVVYEKPKQPVLFTGVLITVSKARTGFGYNESLFDFLLCLFARLALTEFTLHFSMTV